MTLQVSRKKLCGLLTTREAEVLGPLHAHLGKFASVALSGVAEPGWCRCRDIGGTRDSHHSLTLRRLAAKGLVETMTLEATARALSKPLLAYRINRAGIELWAEYADYVRHARVAHPKDNRTPKECAV
jgi:hypothetical protein